MRETRFIEQNKEKWAEYENMLHQNHPDVDRLYGLFFSISDDLAFARSHYPNRSVRVYLNGLARILFRNVYGSRRFSWKAIRTFWVNDLPLALYQTRFEQNLAFYIFLLAGTIGAVSTLIDPSFAKSILGDSYISMTVENIRSGDPTAVYSSSEPWEMFYRIAQNNLLVCVFGYTTGILAGLGTLFHLLYNGIMVGTFQSFFFHYDVGIKSFLAIWMHGALEISSLVIGSGAGLSLARGLLFPGTYTRLQALLLAGRRSAYIIMGIFPIILVAAYIESFITRYSTLFWPIRLALILLSFGFIFYYFFWLPRRKGPKLAEEQAQSDGLTFTRQVEFSPREIYSFGEVAGFTFTSFFSRIPSLLPLFLVISLVYSWITIAFNPDFQGIEFLSDNELANRRIFSFGQGIFGFVLHLVLSSASLWLTARQLHTKFKPAGTAFPVFLFSLGVVFQVGLISVGFALDEFLYWIVFLVGMGVVFIWMGTNLMGEGDFFNRLGNAFRYSTVSMGKSLACFLFFLSLGGLALLFLRTPLLHRGLELVRINLPPDPDGNFNTVWGFIPVFIGYMVIQSILHLFLTASSILQFSFVEEDKAEGLLTRIRNLSQGDA